MRIAVLKRHLESTAESIVPRDVYLWLTRDNVELRDRMLAFLEVGVSVQTTNNCNRTPPSVRTHYKTNLSQT